MDVNVEQTQITVVKEAAAAGKHEELLSSRESLGLLANEKFSADPKTADVDLVVDVEQTSEFETLKIQPVFEATQSGGGSDDDDLARLNVHLAMARPEAVDQHRNPVSSAAMAA